jgi:photosystem II stability/assembly factor-like uncharacterized protein
MEDSNGVTRAAGALTLVLAVACSPASPSTGVAGAPVLVAQRSGTSALLQAVSAVSERVAWVSGQSATYARTTDGGEHWRAAVVPGDTALQFRDVHAVDSLTAYLLAAGPGERSRIYKTTDGGASWTLQFTNRDSSAFFDCFAFWDARRGIAFSDASGGRFPILLTADGRTWTAVPAESLPAPLPGEGGFAASGTCAVTGEGGRAWIGTGNAGTTRVLRTADYGRSWSVATTTIAGAEGAGITSLAFRDSRHGVAMGGGITAPDEPGRAVAVTRDGGATWTSAGRPTITGAVYGGAYVPGMPTPTLVAVSPKGASWSADEGATWAHLDGASYWSVGFASRRAGWMVGPGGRITRVSFAR